jgi:hypothetical protein
MPLPTSGNVLGGRLVMTVSLVPMWPIYLDNGKQAQENEKETDQAVFSVRQDFRLESHTSKIVHSA